MEEVNWRNLRGGVDYYIYDENLPRHSPFLSGKKKGTFDRITYLAPSTDYSNFAQWSDTYIPNGTPFARFTNLTDVNDNPNRLDSGLGASSTNEYSVFHTKFYKVASMHLKEKILNDEKAITQAREALMTKMINSGKMDMNAENKYNIGKTLAQQNWFGGIKHKKIKTKINKSKKNKSKKNKTKKNRNKKNRI